MTSSLPSHSHTGTSLHTDSDSNSVTPESLKHAQLEHEYELNNVFFFSRQLQRECDADQRLHADQMLREAIHKCQAYIDQGVACGTGICGVTTQFLRRRNWAHLEQATALWARYMAAGYIDADAHIDFNVAAISFFTPVGLLRPLEMAAINENIDAMRALLEAGADSSLVPSRDWSGHSFGPAPDTGDIAPATIDDIHSFILAQTPNQQVAPVLSCLVTEVTMRRRIAEVTAAAAVQETTPQAGQGVHPKRRLV